MSKLIVKTLEQRGRTGNLDRRFNLNSRNFIDVQVGLKSQAFRYPVNLLFLDDKPAETTILPWKWIYISIILTLCTITIAYIYVIQANGSPLPELIAKFEAKLATNLSMWIKPTLTGSAILMLISIMASSRKMQKFIILKTKYGQAPLVKFLYDVPNNEDVHHFIKEIQHRIAQATKECKHNMEDILSAELAGLRDLKEHNILNKKEYNQAKQRLIKLHSTLDHKEINESKKQKLRLVQYQ